jgi:hypothetical protein
MPVRRYNSEDSVAQWVESLPRSREVACSTPGARVFFLHFFTSRPGEKPLPAHVLLPGSPSFFFTPERSGWPTNILSPLYDELREECKM